MSSFRKAIEEEYRILSGKRYPVTMTIEAYEESERGAVWVTKIDRMYPRDMINRGMRGWHLCGYAWHEWEGIPDVPEFYEDERLVAHGGVTYGQICAHIDSLPVNEGTIAGFDCAHAGDEGNPNCADPQWVLAGARDLYDQMDEIYLEEVEEHGSQQPNL